MTEQEFLKIAKNNNFSREAVTDLIELFGGFDKFVKRTGVGEEDKLHKIIKFYCKHYLEIEERFDSNDEYYGCNPSFVIHVAVIDYKYKLLSLFDEQVLLSTIKQIGLNIELAKGIIDYYGGYDQVKFLVSINKELDEAYLYSDYNYSGKVVKEHIEAISKLLKND